MSDYETMQRRRSFIVGFFVLLAVVAFFWLIFKFGDLPILVSEIKSYEVRIQFPTAPGVQRDTPVRFCGYQIGRVTDVDPPQVLRDLKTNEYYHQTLVIASIDNQFKNIPDIVEARLMTRGLGSSYIELIAPPVDVRGGKVLVEGSLLQGTTGVASEFFPEQTQQKLDELLSKITVLTNNINDVVGDAENKQNIKTTLANISSASVEANDLLIELKDAVVTGKTTLANADQRMERLTASLVNTSDKLGEVMSHLEVIADKINSGQGSAGRFINDGRLYEQLLEDSRQVEMLLKDLKTFIAESKEKGIPLKLK